MNMGLFGSLGALGSNRGLIAATTRSKMASVSKLPVGIGISMLMDSQGARGNNATTSSARTTVENRQTSELQWALGRSPRAINRIWWDSTANAANRIPGFGEQMAADNYYSGLNLSYSGDTLSGMKKRVAQVAATGSPLCFLCGGTNIGTGDATAAVRLQAAADIVDMLGDLGVRCVVGTPRARRVSTTPTGSEITPSQMGVTRDVVDGMLANALDWGAVGVMDLFTTMLDLVNYPVGHQLYGTPVPLFVNADGVHLAPMGSELLSYEYEAQIANNVEQGTWFDPSNLASLVSNTDMTGGVSGTVGTSITGQVATGWALLNPSGAGQPVTAVGAVEGGKQIIRPASTGAGSGFQLIRMQRAASVSTGFTSTDWVVAGWKYQIVNVDPSMVMMQAHAGMGSTISTRGMGQSNANYNLEPSPIRDKKLSGWIFTEPLLVESRTTLQTRLDIAMRGDLANVGQPEVAVEDAWLIKVPNPETAYPWTP